MTRTEINNYHHLQWELIDVPLYTLQNNNIYKSQHPTQGTNLRTLNISLN